MSESLSAYLAPRGRAPGIGPESGRQVRDGIARYRSPHGSTRYVLYRSGHPLAALQIVSRDGRHATIANVYVLPSERRRGLASRLLQKARADFTSVRHAEEAALSEHARGWRRAVGDPSRPRRSRRSRRDPFDRRAHMKAIERELKEKDRAKISALRSRAHSAEAEDKTRCRIARAEGVLRSRKIRERAEKVRLAIRRELPGVQSRIKSHCAPSGAALAGKRELAEERRYLAQLRRIAEGVKKRGPSVKKTSAEARSESDDEVRQNIPEDLIPLWNRVRRSIKGSARMTRTEAFLKYVEEHPGEEFEGIEDKTDALIADLERQQRAGRRDPLPISHRRRRLTRSRY